MQHSKITIQEAKMRICIRRKLRYFILTYSMFLSRFYFSTFLTFFKFFLQRFHIYVEN